MYAITNHNKEQTTMPALPLAFPIGSVTIELRHGNIALMSADAIVNAVNENLSFGTGVAGAISAQGGDSIQNECHEIGFCPTGSAVITNAGNLNARYVIHAVGPMYGEGNEKEKLSSAVKKSLDLAEEKNLQSIAFPAIATGTFHYPLAECATVMTNAIKEKAPSLKSLQTIIICLNNEEKLGVFRDTLSA
ncbi:MAG: macro domain-containing protein [Ignavibacteriota bacterium]